MISEKWINRLALVGFWLVVLNIALSTIIGFVVALFGGSLTNWGDGAGGGYAIPGLVNTIALILSLPALIYGLYLLFRKDDRAVKYTLVFVGALLIGIAYIVIPHELDPCYRGIWTAISRYGDIRLCEYFGSELNIHTRFHLFWHAAPTIPLVLLYWFGIAKLYPELFSAWRKS